MRIAVGRRAASYTLTALVVGGAMLGTGSAAGAALSARWRIAYAAKTNSSFFVSTAALSARDVWAVGTNQPPGPVTSQTAIVRRWNGRSWAAVSLPSTYRHAFLFAVAGSSPSNVWVFGQWRNSNGLAGHAFALRWHGSWSRVGWWATYSSVSGSVVLSPGDVWMFSAFGTWHYDGHGWTKFTLSFSLAQASAISANDIWAVGNDNTTSAPVLAKWSNGTWTAQPVPVTGLRRPTFADVLAQTDQNVWIVGGTQTSGGGFRALSLHWHSGGWTRYPAPKWPDQMGAVVSDGHSGVWATFADFSTANVVAHFVAGSWRLVTLPGVRGKRTAAIAVTRVPRTSTVYAAGSFFFGGLPSTNGLILRYGR